MSMMDWQKRVHPTTRQIAKTSFGPGDDVRVWFKILEQGKERLGQFEGVVLRSAGRGAAKTFTVRRVTHGEGVERIFPMDAPIIERVEVLRHGSTRRGRLYFLRRVVKRTRLATAQGSEGTTTTAEGAPRAAGTAAPRTSEPVSSGSTEQSSAGVAATS